MDKARHAELARELAEGIAAGRFPVGSLLPTEFELCERHAASRYTVRLALQALQEQGLISRRKNVGTRVEAQRPIAGFTQSVSSVEDLAQFGATHLRVMRSVEEVVADLPLAKELGCAGGTRWLRFSSVRMDGAGGAVRERAAKVSSRAAAASMAQRPLGWSDVYIDAEYADIAPMVNASPGALISELIERRYGRRIARIRQDIHAVNLSAPLAAELKAEADSPALKIVRRYMDASGEAFEISVTVHPADRFIFSMEMNRAKD